MSGEKTKEHAEEAEKEQEIRAIEGPTAQLGPPDVRHEEDGGVTVEGEPVDDPDEFKGDPIPGGPTDDEAPPDLGSEEGAQEAEDQRGD